MGTQHSPTLPKPLWFISVHFPNHSAQRKYLTFCSASFADMTAKQYFKIGKHAYFGDNDEFLIDTSKKEWQLYHCSHQENLNDWKPLPCESETLKKHLLEIAYPETWKKNPGLSENTRGKHNHGRHLHRSRMEFWRWGETPPLYAGLLWSGVIDWGEGSG